MSVVTKFLRPHASRNSHTTYDQTVTPAGSRATQAAAFSAAILLIFAAGAQNLSHAWTLGMAVSPFRAAVLAAAAGGATLLAPLAFAAVVHAIRGRAFGQALVALVLGSGCLLFVSTSSLGFVAGARDAAGAEARAVSESREIARARFDAAKAELAKLTGTSRRVLDRRRELEATMTATAADLRQQPPARLADSQSVAITHYLNAAGLDVDAASVGTWLNLAMVLWLELAAALSLMVAGALGPVRASKPVHAPQNGPVTVNHETPADVRAEAAERIVSTLKANGGRASASVRRLGAMVGATKSTAHNALSLLIASGVVVRAGSELILRA